jgi:hypothetical protein
MELGVSGATGTMLVHWALSMIQAVERYSNDPLDLVALSDTRADNARLRKLIAEAEWASKDDMERSTCPWCGLRQEGGMAQVPKAGEHEPSCPAFSAPGVVR